MLIGGSVVHSTNDRAAIFYLKGTKINLFPTFCPLFLGKDGRTRTKHDTSFIKIFTS